MPTWLLTGLLTGLNHGSPGAQTGSDWQALDPNNTVVMTLPAGEVIIELNPHFAPATVAQFKKLVRAEFYDGLGFYRVIDGFVAQGGDGSDIDPDQAEQHPTLPAEFERPWSDTLPWTPAQQPDLFAAETGFIDGFPAARDPKTERIWLTHCPCAVAMARGNTQDSGATDFYIVIGQAPRYLDRNLTVFGRVVSGMDTVQQIRRGPADANGIIEDTSDQTPIQTMKLAADRDTPLGLERVNTSGQQFIDLLASRKDRSHAFFHHKPPAVLDVCQQPIATRPAGGNAESNP